MIKAVPAGYVGSSVQSIESRNYFSICYQKIVEFCLRIWHLMFNFFKSKSVILSDDAGEFQRDKRPFIEVFQEVPLLQQGLHARWLISNELEQAETIEWLEESQNVYGDTFIGTGCFFTLSAFSIRPEQVDHLVVIDISLKVAEFWKDIEQILLKDSNREKTIGLIMEKFSLKREECLENRSWLSTEEQFLKVKKLFTDNKFAFLLANFTDNNTLEKIGLALKNASRSIDTVYQSNIGSVNLAGKKIGGAYFLSLRINDFLVRKSIKSDQQTDFLEIYVDDGKMAAGSQKRRLVHLSDK